MPIVLPPMRESFLRSPNEATPVTSDANTKGTAMSRNPEMKMVPHGAIQSSMNPPHPFAAASEPYSTPRVKPMMICQWSLRYQAMGGRWLKGKGQAICSILDSISAISDR